MTELNKLVNLSREAVSNSDVELETAIIGLAKRASLNKEEIHRVCQFSNTLKMLSLYKESSDKTVEFETADPSRVINHIFMDAPEEKELEKVSYSYSETLFANPDFLPSTKGSRPVDFGVEEIPDHEYTANSLTKRAFINSDKLYRELDELRVNKECLLQEAQSCLEKVAHKLRGEEGTFSTFEQNTRDALGDKSLPFLDLLHKRAGFNASRLESYTKKSYPDVDEKIKLVKTAMENVDLSTGYSMLEKAYELQADTYRKQVLENVRKVTS